jgi:hypothetical protein
LEALEVLTLLLKLLALPLLLKLLGVVPLPLFGAIVVALALGGRGGGEREGEDQGDVVFGFHGDNYGGKVVRGCQCVLVVGIHSPASHSAVLSGV